MSGDRDGGGGLGGLGRGGGLGGSGLSFMTASRLKIHPPQQVLEARVVVEQNVREFEVRERCLLACFTT